MYFTHEWNDDEIRNCYRQAYGNCDYLDDNENDGSRFAGLLLPFIGGLIVGGLFIPKTGVFQSNPNPTYSQPPVQYPPYPPYYPPYQAPMNPMSTYQYPGQN